MSEPAVETPAAENGARSPDLPRGRSPLKSGRRRLAALVLGSGALVAAVGASALWMHYSVRESTDDAQVEGDIVPIGVRVGGHVRTVRVEDNQHVKAGEVLLEIDRSDYEVALAKAEAEAADARAAAAAAHAAVAVTDTSARSEVDESDAALDAARQEVEAAVAQLGEARAAHDKARSDLERYRKLVDRDEISKQQFDAAVAAEAQAASAASAAEAGLAAARSRVAEAQARRKAAGTASSQIEAVRAKADAADAVVRKDEAAVEQAKLNLSYTTVTAPADGVVSRKAVQPGQVVQPGQQVMAVVPLDKVWIVANFKESQLRRMRPGQPATVYVDAYGRRYAGHVDSIGGATAAKFSLLPPENATGNFVKVVQRVPVKIVLEKDQDPEHVLRPGMSVVPTVLTR